jgi:hypothetical protein
MPSMDTLLASVVCQLRTAWSPAEITVGATVICAVGAGTEAGGAVSAGGGGGDFFLQPATAIKETSNTAGIKMRERAFNG